ncbi:SDR family oxidoreductase [Mucilaginibacter sp. Bleaf8]|uniref:SDR family oxidoreductase n=1 Tax=Mucilaginibacter sp. Bleaf8 TaxID=2834430 RepID=UPI001BCCD0DB|nr:SDR family oxidoreductase [Mucilaginibacter sp. Bleaf8]MBS7563290.1 SDR family oxidoreductase [Mucilaginibacter sp. Bleaf8]
MTASKYFTDSPLCKKTIVIAGATSGIGRATALEFARHGAKLVLAARQKDVLDEMVDLCDRLGGKAVAVVTDVTDAEAVKKLAKDACIFGGSLDVWVNIAGIGALGEFETVPIEVHEQVIRTNLMGYINGAHAAIPHFKKQKHGIIINMNSVGGWVAFPYGVSYTASKFGLRGYSEALRAELIDCPDIHICDVFPGFVDTPGPSHAANYTGKLLKPAPPVVPTYKVAHTIVSLAQNPKGAVTLGSAAYLAKFGQWLSPKLTRWAATKFMRTYLKNAEPAPVTNGSIFEPTGSHNQISGGYTNKKVTNKNVARAAGVIGIVAGTALVLRKLLK